MGQTPEYAPGRWSPKGDTTRGRQNIPWSRGTEYQGPRLPGLRHDPDATRPIIWCEGAKAAKAAALKLPADDFDVVGFFSASTIPNAATLAKIAKGRPCVVWPDYDEAGAKAGQRLVSDLRQAGAADDVVTVDPALLGLTAGRHDDAEQWHPDELTERRTTRGLRSSHARRVGAGPNGQVWADTGLDRVTQGRSRPRRETEHPLSHCGV